MNSLFINEAAVHTGSQRPPPSSLLPAPSSLLQAAPGGGLPPFAASQALVFARDLLSRLISGTSHQEKSAGHPESTCRAGGGH